MVFLFASIVSFEAICLENFSDFLFCFLDILRCCFSYRQTIVTVEIKCNEGQHVSAHEFACVGFITWAHRHVVNFSPVWLRSGRGERCAWIKMRSLVVKVIYIECYEPVLGFVGVCLKLFDGIWSSSPEVWFCCFDFVALIISLLMLSLEFNILVKRIGRKSPFQFLPICHLLVLKIW